jgi:hypothetical protein
MLRTLVLWVSQPIEIRSTPVAAICGTIALPDAYLKQIAVYFASSRPPFPAPAVPTVSNDILAPGDENECGPALGDKPPSRAETPLGTGNSANQKNSADKQIFPRRKKGYLFPVPKLREFAPATKSSGRCRGFGC